MVADCVSPAVTVKLVDVPIGVPAALKKEMLPVHDAAGEVDVTVVGFSARFATLTCIVSLVASPTGGKLEFRATVGGVLVAKGAWASAVWEAAPAITVRLSKSFDVCITLTTRQSANSFTGNRPERS
jgi:hypothetical protein